MQNRKEFMKRWCGAMEWLDRLGYLTAGFSLLVLGMLIFSHAWFIFVTKAGQIGLLPSGLKLLNDLLLVIILLEVFRTVIRFLQTEILDLEPYSCRRHHRLHEASPHRQRGTFPSSRHDRHTILPVPHGRGLERHVHHGADRRCLHGSQTPGAIPDYVTLVFRVMQRVASFLRRGGPVASHCARPMSIEFYCPFQGMGQIAECFAEGAGTLRGFAEEESGN